MFCLSKTVKSFFFCLICIAPIALLSANELKENSADMKSKVASVQDEVNDLVDHGGRYVYLQLAQKNRLSPFAVGREANGAIIMMEVPKNEKQASFQNKVLKLRQMLKMAADAGKFVAGALFVQAQVPHKGKTVDGVAIEMEHKAGISALRFSPYEVDRENKKIKFKKPVDKVKPVVFFKDVLNQTAENSN